MYNIGLPKISEMNTVTLGKVRASYYMYILWEPSDLSWLEMSPATVYMSHHISK